MQPRFIARKDGIIEVSIGDSGSLLEHALNDSIGSRAPRGAVHEGLSTYWIDRTEEAVRRAIEHGLADPFASGNVTYLRLDGDRVVAAYDFDPDEQEAASMPLDDFLELLGEWRRFVVAAGGVSGADALNIRERPPRPLRPPP